jgi:DNA repair protein RecN (Recombination protein N)
VLTELRVRNLAVIADVTLRLEGGLNVLTGETGAGKSILVDALSLLLGERASGDLVRPGASRAVVEAAFDLDPTGPIARAADESGVALEDGRLVVKREINAEGRNRAWANGSPTTVGVLAALGRNLVDLHGQHESQSLLRPALQRDILDAFAGAAVERGSVAEGHAVLQELRAREVELRSRLEDVRKRADYLRHVVREIEDVTPVPGEDEELALESRRLTHAEELTRLGEQLAEVLDGDGQESVTSALSEASRTLDQLERIDESVSRWRERLDAAATGVDELARDVREYATEIELDPGRLSVVESRRDQLYRLLQKYGPTLEEVLLTGERSLKELDVLDTADTDLAGIANERATAEERLREAASSLTETRNRAAGTLGEAVDALLPLLGMPEGRFLVNIRPMEKIGPTGADSIRFAVQLNRGLEARPLAMVASGGELSRLMLALKVVLVRHDAIPTLVFDEVDQGIGGEIGGQVGDSLARVAVLRQVLVITHLPQIAARADHHLKVTKGLRDNVATTELLELRGDERAAEIARMLGDSGDAGLRRHAEELLERESVNR